jgi:hypothetical protein
MVTIDGDIEAWSKGRPVADLRHCASALGQREPQLAGAAAAHLAHSRVPEARMIAGYAQRRYLKSDPAAARELCELLVGDEDWTVREAVTFAVRDATIDDPDLTLGLLRSWATSGDPRRHRAFIVVARQPRRQQPAVAGELVALMREPLMDGDAYVRKNIPFAIRYLARNQPGLVVAELPGWSASGNRGLELSALSALEALRGNAVLPEHVAGTAVDALLRSANRATRVRAARIAP